MRLRELKNVALYARVSTKNSQDPETQLGELRAYAAGRKLNVMGEYVDHGVSGTKEQRPHLDRLMKDAGAGKFDAVVVWRFDRFARSTSHLVKALEEFQALGIHFISLSESIDTSTPMGKMVFTVLGAVAELERNIIVERVNAGLRRARRQGKTLGRPKLIVNRNELCRRRAAGESIRTIAQAMGLSYGTTIRLLSA